MAKMIHDHHPSGRCGPSYYISQTDVHRECNISGSYLNILYMEKVISDLMIWRLKHLKKTNKCGKQSYFSPSQAGSIPKQRNTWQKTDESVTKNIYTGQACVQLSCCGFVVINFCSNSKYYSEISREGLVLVGLMPCCRL